MFSEKWQEMVGEPNNASEMPLGSLAAYRPGKRMLALGLAVNHLMTTQVFKRMPFGSWSQVLAGMINRDHYIFIIDETQDIRGFAGWGLATQEKAEAWLMGAQLKSQDCTSGNCIIVFAWWAETPQTNQFLISALKHLHRDKAALYFKRYYANGKVRPMKISRRQAGPIVASKI